ncbi:MAG: DUF3568 family protein [Pseudomonadota bacterium]
MMKGKILLLLIGLCVAGCAPLVFFGAGTAVGLGGYKFYQGKMTVTYEAPLMKTWDATLKALENLNLEITNQKHDLTSGYIEAKRADTKSVIINLEYQSAQETNVHIRVGVFGNESGSTAIRDEIRKVLFKN